MEERYNKLNEKLMDFMSKDSKKTVEILKLESIVSSQNEELANLRNSSNNSVNTQLS